MSSPSRQINTLSSYALLLMALVAILAFTTAGFWIENRTLERENAAWRDAAKYAVGRCGAAYVGEPEKFAPRDLRASCDGRWWAKEP